MKTPICECLEEGSSFPLRPESDNSHKGYHGGLDQHITEQPSFSLVSNPSQEDEHEEAADFQSFPGNPLHSLMQTHLPLWVTVSATDLLSEWVDVIQWPRLLGKGF